MTLSDPQLPHNRGESQDEAAGDEILAPATPGAEALGDGASGSAPDHSENTGDNLRHAAEVQESARDDKTDTAPPEQSAPETPLPDFNT